MVLRAPTGTVNDLSAQVSQTVGNLSKLPDVISVTNPLSSGAVSPGGTIAYITMHLSVLPKTLGAPYVADLHQATRPLTGARAQVEYGGQFDALTRPKAKDGRSERVGFGVALVVLLAGFGSLAAALPLLTALVATLAGEAVSTSGRAVLVAATTVSDSALPGGEVPAGAGSA